MKEFTEVQGVTAPIELSNIDTDMIIPKQFLKTIKRSGLGEGLFYEMRYDEKGNLNKNFILNEKPFSDSKILIAFENFGCGSSREHAPWAIKDFGINVILAISFADIFFNNCFKNGILPIKLNKGEIDFLISNLPKYKNILKVNLINQVITLGTSDIKFDIESYRKESLLNGWDDIDLTLKHKEKITSYEENNPNSFWIDIER
ncbi:MAG: 3-isopropylmalate dehydratase small subunit [Alphaproteobacteria bacterium]